MSLSESARDEARGGVDRHPDHGPVQARLPQHLHPGHSPPQSRRARDGRSGLHDALHSGARGPRPSRRVRGSQPSAAQGHRGVPGRPCVRDRQPPQSVGRLGRRHPGDPAVEARRGRHRHRRRLPRLARDRAAAVPRLPRGAGGADQPDQASRGRPQRPDRLRRGRRSIRATSWWATGRASWSSRSTSPKRWPRRRSSRPRSRISCRRRSSEGRSIFGIYPPAPEAREEFKRWRAAQGR